MIKQERDIISGRQEADGAKREGREGDNLPQNMPPLSFLFQPDPSF